MSQRQAESRRFLREAEETLITALPRIGGDRMFQQQKIIEWGKDLIFNGKTNKKNNKKIKKR